MKKKRNLIGVCLVAVLMLALTVIGYAAGDGEAAPEYGAWCLVPPLVTIVLAFVTKQTIISMFIGIWVGATIIHHFNPIDGLIGSFTGYLVPSIADSWNAGMLIVAAIVLGVVVLYNLGVMSYTERYREMATLKVVGFKDKKIAKLLIGQNMWVTVAGIVLGLPLAAGTLTYLVKELASEYEMRVVMGPATFIVSILTTFGVSLLVSLMVARKNKKIDMVEALKGAE